MIAIALVLAAVAGGTASTYLWDEDSPISVRLAAGTCLGLTCLGLIGFVFASLLGSTYFALVLATLIVASPAALLVRRGYRGAAAHDVGRAVECAKDALRGHLSPAAINALLFVALCVPLALVFSRAVFTTADGLYTGVYVNRNDLPLHIAIVRGFADGGNLPPQHPEFAGARLTYPFLIDFIAAQLTLAGLRLEHAFTVQNLLLLSALVVLLYRWTLTITASQFAARLTPLVVLAGSGLGWLLMLREYHAGGTGALTFLAQLPRDYTINTNGLRWGNLTTTMLVPQRSFLLGLPLFVMISTWWWRAVSDPRRPAHPVALMVAAGVAAGLLPLAHPHTFIVVIGIAGALALLFRRWRLWVLFFVLALAIALPQLWWISRGSMIDGHSFVGWHVGWSKGADNVAWFWLKNTGIFIPLLVAAIIMRGRLRIVPPTLLVFYSPFLLCFIVPQFVKLAPRVSGNIKVLVYWYIASVPLVALLLAALWRRGSLARIATAAAVVSLTLAASLDAWRVMSGASAVRIFNASDVAFASVVQRVTPPGAVILHAPTRNHPVFLAGRLSVLGNLSHVESHGFDYLARETAVRRIFAGDPEAPSLLANLRVAYIVLGPQERRQLTVDERFLQRFPLVAHVGEFSLYRIDPSRGRQSPISRVASARGQTH